MLHRARTLPQRTLALINRALTQIQPGPHAPQAAPRRAAASRLRFETMEPRVLMSADIAPGVLPAEAAQAGMFMGAVSVQAETQPATIQLDWAAGALAPLGGGIGAAPGGSGFVEQFDAGSFTTPLQPLPAGGSLAYAGGVQGTLQEGQSEELTLELAAGQPLSLRLSPQDAGLRLQVAVLDGSGQQQGLMAAGQPGEVLTLVTGTGAGGTTRIQVSSLAGAGGYALEAFAGAALEGADSTNLSDAADLGALMVALPGGSGGRATVVGSVAQPTAPVAFAGEDFEQEGLGERWTLTSSNPNVWFDLDDYWVGEQRFTGLLSNGDNVAPSLDEAVLTLDLTGRQNLVLDFDTFGWDPVTESFPEGAFTGSAFADGVAISADGGTTWYGLASFPVEDAGDLYYTEHFTLDLGAELAARGLSAGADFKIKFQHADSAYVPEGSEQVQVGWRWWDNIVVSEALSLRPAAVAGVTASAPVEGNLAAAADGHMPARGQTLYDQRSAHWNAGAQPVQLVFDLGQARSVSDLVLSLDGGDRYGVEVSLDGSSWSSLLSVGTQGQGFNTYSTVSGDALYDAALDFAPVPARYLRVSGNESADGRFAVGELRVLQAPATADVEDWYRIDLAQGERVSAALQFAPGADSAVPTTLELYAADGTRLTYATADAGQAAGIQGLRAPQQGSYYLRVRSGAGSEYGLSVTRDAALGSAAAAPRDITALPVVVDRFVEGTGTLGAAIHVAVVGNNAGLVERLNASTRFGIEAVNVSGAAVDTLQELSAYDVVVIGDDEVPEELDAMAPALRQWVEAGGGLVAAGWTVWAAGPSTEPTLGDIDAVVPVSLVGGEGWVEYGTLDVLDPNHPVLAGLDDFELPPGAQAEFPLSGPDDGTQVLARLATGEAVVVAGQPGNGRSLYLGPAFASPYVQTRSAELDRLLEQSVAWASAKLPRDYLLRAGAGDTLEATVQRLGSAPGAQPGQDPLPLLELVQADGTVLATSDTGTLGCTVADAGTYTVRVVAQGPADGFVLRVAGSTAAAPDASVVQTSVDALASAARVPAYVDVGFDAPLLLSSADAGDFSVDGIGAQRVEVLAPDRLRFHLDASADAGTRVLQIAAGALTDIHGNAVAAWSHEIQVETTLPVVTASSIAPGAVLDSSPALLRITFSKDLDGSVLDLSDMQLTYGAGGAGIALTSWRYDAATRTLELGLPRLDEGEYALRLVSGAESFRDLLGLPLDGGPSDSLPSGQDGDGTADDFVLNFVVDAPHLVLAPQAQAPLAALTVGATATGYLPANSSVDLIDLTLDQAALLSLSIQPAADASADLQLQVFVFNDYGELFANVTGEPGAALLLQGLGDGNGGPLPVHTYTVYVSNLAGHGHYTVNATLNAVAEAEPVLGTDNGSPAAAQDLMPSRLALAEGIDRLAATGRLEQDGTDWYSFTLEAGQTASLALALAGTGSTAAPALALFDADGVLLATAVDGVQAQRLIQDFTHTGAAAATYHARVSGAAAADYTLVVTRGATFGAGLPGAAAQPLGTTGAALGYASAGTATDGGGPTTPATDATLQDGAGWNWDIRWDGSINDGTDDAYDGGLRLHVEDVDTESRFDFGGDQGYLDMDGRQLVLTGALSNGLQATRKILVPADRPYARFLETLTNTGSQARTLNLVIQSNLGSDNGTYLIGTQSGGEAFGPQDRWLVTDDPSDGSWDPALAHVVWGAGATAPTTAWLDGDEMQYGWRVTLAPGQTVSLLHFAAQASNRAEALALAGRIDAMDFGQMLDGLSSAELRSVVNRRTDAGTLYGLEANAGDTLVLDVQALQGAQLPLQLRVLGPGGSVVLDTAEAAAPLSALSASFVAPQAGTYTVEVLGGSGEGAYLLRASGSSVNATSFGVQQSSVDELTRTSQLPSFVDLGFDAALLLSSVQAGDLTLDGTAAQRVEILAPDRLRFHFDTPAAGDGPRQLQLAAGALTSIHGAGIDGWSHEIVLDTTLPVVTASSIAAGAVLDGAPALLHVTFSEDLDTSVLDLSDIQLTDRITGDPVDLASWSYDAGTRTLELGLPRLADGRYELRLLSRVWGFRDLLGLPLNGGPSATLPSGQGDNAADDFVLAFSVDSATQPLAATPRQPLAALAAGGAATSHLYGEGDVDSFALTLDSASLLSLSVQPADDAAGALQLRLSVYDAGGTLLASVDGEPGTALLLQAVADADGAPLAAGSYRVDVQSLGGQGHFTLGATLNAVAEGEPVTGSDNGTRATAQDLMPSRLVLAEGIDRFAALGRLEQGGTDWFSFTLEAGQTASLALTPTDPASTAVLDLTLYDAGGELAGGTGARMADDVGGVSAQRAILGFTHAGTAAATYYVRVNGGGAAATDYALVLTRGATFGAGLPGAAQPLGPTGAVIGHSSAATPTSTSASNTFSATLRDGSNWNWDIQSDGQIGDGTNDAYDGGMRFFVSDVGSGSQTYFAADQGRLEMNGRQLVLTDTMSGNLQATRKILVAADKPYARFLDSLTNTGTQARTLDLVIQSNLGSDSGTYLIATQSGGGSFGPQDHWLVTDDYSNGGGDPTMAHVLWGTGATAPASASLSGDNLRYSWRVTLAPGQTVSLLHFAAQASNRTVARSVAEQIDAMGYDQMLSGLGSIDLRSVINRRVAAGEVYSLQANAGDTLALELQALQGAQLPLRLRVYAPGHTLVLDTAEPAAAMATLSAGVVAAQSGTYEVEVLTGSAEGTYLLRTSGSTAIDPAPSVTAVTPAPGTVQGTVPSEIVLQLSEAVRADSVSAEDLQLSAGTVTGVQLLSGDRVRFLVDVPVSETPLDFGLAAGAFTDLQGQGSSAYSGRFTFDLHGPRVSASTPTPTASTPFDTWTFTFDEELDATSVSIADVVAFTGPTGQNLLGQIYSVTASGRVLTVNFYTQLVPGSYSMTLGPDIRDLVGNRMDQDGDAVSGEALEDRFTAALTLLVPDLVPESVTVSAASAALGTPLSATWTVRNAGTDATRQTGWYDRLVLSKNDVFGDGDDYYLTQTWVSYDTLAVGGSYTRTVNFTPPIDVALAGGEYRLLVYVDYHGYQAESAEGNNAVASVPFTLTVPPLPDLTVSHVAAPAFVEAGKPVQLTWTIANQGTAAAAGWYDRLYLSTDASYSSNDISLADVYNGTALAAGASLERSAWVTVPVSRVGSWYVVVRSDISNTVKEYDREDNNTAASADPVTVMVPTQDLVATAVAAPAEASFGQAISVQWTVQNTGTGPTVNNWYDRLWLSTDGTVDAGDIYLGEFWSGGNTPLAAGASYSRSRDVQLPFTASAVAGSYRVLVRTDHYGNEPESNEANNTGSSAAITLSVPPTPDLVVSGVSVPGAGTLRSGDTVVVRFTLTNQGAAPASNFQYRLSLTDDASAPGSQDYSLGSFWFSDTLDPGESVELAQSVTLPIDAPGNWYVGVTADSGNHVYEHRHEDNNSALSALLSVPLPPLADLVVTQIGVPQDALAGQGVPVSWTVTNQGTRSITGGTWSDAVYLSYDGGTSDGQFVGYFAYTGDLAAGASVTRTQNITLPANQSASYTLVVRTDFAQEHYEHLGENNNRSVATHAINVTLPPTPNLQVTAITPPEGAASSVGTTVSWVVSNTGTGATSSPSWRDQVYLSLDDVLDASDVLVGTVANPSYLGAGESYSSSLSFTVPRGMAGDYRVLVFTDSQSNVYEHQAEQDNVGASAPMHVTLTPPPNLQVQQVNAPAQAFSGQPMTLSWTVANNGTGRTLETGWSDRIVMSADAVLDGGDLELAQVWHEGTLDVGGSYGASYTVQLPIGVSGEHYFFVVADFRNAVFEHTDEGDNAGHDAVATNVLLTPPPDLEVDALTVPASGRAGETVRVQYSVTNYGATATAENWWADRFYLSLDGVLDAGDLLLETVNHSGVLAVDARYGGSVELTLPRTLADGNYRVIVHTDAGNQVFEGVAGAAGNPEANNVAVSATAIAIVNRPANLVVDSFTASEAGQSGQQISLAWTVRNAGTGATLVTGWHDVVTVSRDEVYGNGDDVRLVAEWAETETEAPLAPGATYSRRVLATLPFSLDSGSYRLFLRADGNDWVYEGGTAGEQDNTAQRMLTVTRVTPDLRVTSVTPPAGEVRGNTLSLSWRVENQGLNRTEANEWIDQVWLSSDTALGSGDVLLGTYHRSRSLAAGEGYDASASFALPDGLPSGAYHLIVRTDAMGQVIEGAGENNNVLASATSTQVVPQVLRPDLQVELVDAPATGYSGQALQVSWTVRNTGVDPTAQDTWYDAVYLSRDLVFDRSSDIYLGYVLHFGGLGAGERYEVTQGFTVPGGQTGPFYVFVATDSGQQVREVAELNNAAADTGFTQVSLAPPVDLVAGTVTVPANAVAGQNATLTYSVTNSGSHDALGSWRDSLYLSTDDTWDIGDVLFGSLERDGPLAAGASYSGSLTAALPGLAPGAWRVIVRSDILNTLTETNEANNLSASLDAVALDVQALALGTPVSATIPAGQSAFYKIEVGAGETVRFTLDGAGADDGNELYLRRGGMPTRALFDQAGRDPFEPDQAAVVTATEAGTYYVMVHAGSGAGAHAFTLRAEVLPFSIQAVDRSELGDAGVVTLRVDGARFDAATRFALANAAGEVVEARAVRLDSGNVAYVSFDTRGATLGSWTLMAMAGDGSTTGWSQPLSLVQGEGAEVVARVTGPAQVRPGRTILAELAYANEGDADTMAPLFIVTSPTGTAFGTSVETLGLSGTVLLLGTGTGGAQDVLRAGDRHSVPLLFNAVNAPMRFQARTVEDRSTEPLDFGLLEQALRTPGFSDAAWNARWFGQLQPRLGQTWGDFVRLVNQLSVRFSEPGHPIQDVRELFDLALTADAGFLPSTSYSGTLLDALTGAPMAGVAVAAFLQQGETQIRVSATTTGADGSFTLPYLQAGTYVLSIARAVANGDGTSVLEAAYQFDMNRNGVQDATSPTVTLSGSADASGGVFYAGLRDPASTSSPTNDSEPALAVDSQGRTHMVWMRDGRLWHAVNAGAGWVDAAPLPEGAAGSDVRLLSDARLIDDSSEGLLVTWRAGEGNESEVYYAVGQETAGGGWRWSEPKKVAENTVADGAYAVGIDADGNPVLLMQREDATMSDDTDLYGLDLDVDNPQWAQNAEEQRAAFDAWLASQSDEELLAQGIRRIRDVAPEDTSLDVAAGTFRYRYGESLGKNFPLIGSMKGEFRVDLQGQVDCTLVLRGNGALKFEAAGFEIEGRVGGDVRYKANADTCAYEFQSARISGGVSGAANFALRSLPVPSLYPLFALLDVWGKDGKAGRGEVGLSLNAIWNAGSDFPSWPSEVNGSLRGSMGVNFVGTLLGHETTLRVLMNVRGTVELKNGISLEWGSPPVSVSVLARIKYENPYSSNPKDWLYFKEITWTYPSTGSTDPTSTDVLSLEQMLAQAEGGNLQVTYGVSHEVQAGTLDNHAGAGETQVTNNLTGEGEPVIARDASGGLWAAWASADGISVSRRSGSSWLAPVAIEGSEGYANSHLSMAFDAAGNGLAVWNRLDTSMLSDSSSSEQIQAVIENGGELVYARYDAATGQWSAPALLAARAGDERFVTLQRGADGSIFASWVGSSPTPDAVATSSLFTAVWSAGATGWSEPVEVASAVMSGGARLGVLGGQTILLWAERGADAGSVLRQSTWNGSAWSAPQTPAMTLAPAFAAAAAEPEQQTSPGTEASQDALETSGLPLPTPPEYCCDDDEDPPPYDPDPVIPRDPNDIVGPAGYGEQHWVGAQQTLGYTIRFENASDAQAPAQEVVITQQLDADLDWRTFRVDDFGFGDQRIELAANGAFYQGRLDYSATRGFVLDVSVSIDVATGVVTWRLSTLDPVTGELPTDAQLGFLPANNDGQGNKDGRGEGFVSYTVKAKRTVATGTVIDAKARIVFDTEEPIDTPPIFHTLDAGLPGSSVDPLPARTEDPVFTVSWHGDDEEGGSALASYDVYVSTNGGRWTLWLSETAETQAQFVGQRGLSYAFYSVARDHTGNVEAAPATADATIQVSPGTGTVTGVVFDDADGDGVLDDGEGLLSGWTVYLDADDDGVLDAGERSATTAADGSYAFADVQAGAAVVGRVLPAGWTGTSPAGGRQPVTVVADATTANVRFGAFRLGSVGGVQFDDLDADGVRDAGEVGLGGWTVLLDRNADGSTDATTTTAADGSWRFEDLGPGAWRVSLQPQAGWLATAQTSYGFSLHSGEAAAGRDFGAVRAASIAGVLFEDADGDGQRDADEGLLAGWTVFLDGDADGVLDAGERSTVSDAAGAYRFDALLPGTYTVAEVMQPGWMQTAPAARTAGAVMESTGSDATLAVDDAVLEDSALETTAVSGNAWAGMLTGLDALRTDPRFAGLDGSGVATVVIDTGIDLDHAFFGADANHDGVADRIVYQWDFAGEDADASDRMGHGSHIASLVGSEDATWGGVAQGADLIALKVFDDSGRGTFAYLESALQWVVAHADDFNVGVVNLSLGDGGNWNEAIGRYGLGDELAALAARNIIVTAAAGNHFGRFGGAWGVAYPASDPAVLSVGATWTSDLGGPWAFSDGSTDYTTGADRIASFSQRDDDLLDAFAPGARLVGANATGGVATMQGTSQASAYMAGVATLAQDLAQQTLGRRLSLAEFRSLLDATADRITDGDDENDSVRNSGLSFGRVNVLALAEGILALSQGGTAGPGTGGTDPGTGGGGNPGTQPLAGPGAHSLPVAAGEQATGADFGNFRLARIEGRVFHDADGDGVQGAGESGAGLSGWSVFIDANANGSLDAGESATTTDADGAFAFEEMGPGARRLVMAPPAGWAQVGAGLTVDLHSGATATAALGANALPTLAAVAPQSVDEGGTLQLQLAGADSGGGALRYSLASGPAGATVDADTGVLTWTAPDGFATHGFTVRVTDAAGASAERSFDVNVSDVAPALVLAGSGTVEAGQPYVLGLAATDPGTDTVTGWVIDWGDGIVQQLSGRPASVSHSYATAGSYTVLAMASDEDGSYLAEPHAVQVRVATLRVDSFEATATGFKVRFNAVLDAARLNLANGQGYSLGAPDIVFRDGSGRVVAGSVVVDDDRRGLTFVKTGGVLAAGRYSVQLAAGAQAFVSIDGRELDGNRDGTPGDAFQQSFDVAATATAVLSLGEIARGPGQALNLPAAGAVGMPVTLTGATGATRVAFTLRYDASLLTVTGVANGASLPAGSTVSADLSVPGEVRVVVQTGTALTGTSLELLRLLSSVPATAPYGARQVLDLTAVAISRANGSAIAVRDDDGMHLVAYVGDNNASGGYDMGDVTLLQRVVNLQDTGFGAFPLVDPVVVSDVVVSGTLNSLDGSRLLQQASGTSRPEFPPITVPADALVRYEPNGLAAGASLGTASALSAEPALEPTVEQRALDLQAEALARWQAQGGSAVRLSGGFSDFSLGEQPGASGWLSDWLSPGSTGTAKKGASLRLTPNRAR